jgi:hypothetical protein
VFINIRNNNQNFSVPAELQQTNWQNTLSGSQVSLGTSVTLNNYEYIIFRK